MVIKRPNCSKQTHSQRALFFVLPLTAKRSNKCHFNSSHFPISIVTYISRRPLNLRSATEKKFLCPPPKKRWLATCLVEKLVLFFVYFFIFFLLLLPFTVNKDVYKNLPVFCLPVDQFWEREPRADIHQGSERPWKPSPALPADSW